MLHYNKYRPLNQQSQILTSPRKITTKSLLNLCPNPLLEALFELQTCVSGKTKIITQQLRLLISKGENTKKRYQSKGLLPLTTVSTNPAIL